MPEESSENRVAEYRALAESIGFSLMMWQDVELAHFKLFMKMLGAPRKEVCSAVYFSIESFESRHKMVSRMAHFFLEADHYADQRREWSGTDGGIQKDAKTANDNRNKLAHYGLGFDFKILGEKEDGTPNIQLGPPRLRPAQDNEVSRLLGRTPDRPEHNLTPKEIRGYGAAFQQLGVKIEGFVQSLALPPPQQGLGLLSGLLPYLESKPGSSPTPSKPAPKDSPPSGA